MNNRLTRVNFNTLYFFLIGIIVITRCYGENVFSAKIKCILLLGITVLAILKTENHINYLDVLWMITGVIILVHHSSGYYKIYIVYYLCVLMARYLLKMYVFSIETLLNILLLFSVITSVISWISLISPNMYIAYIVPLINESGQNEVLKQLNRGNLAGLTDHYSRNAYYVVAGILVLFSKLWSSQDLKISLQRDGRKWFLIGFEFITLLAIGKRGHFLFVIFTVYTAYFILQRTVSKSLTNSVKALVLFAIVTVIIFQTVPPAQQTLKRFVMQAASGDISNGRFANYKVALDLFKTRPLLGIGYGGFNYLTANGLTKYTYAGVHNDYLQFLCETGILGFSLFIGLGVHSLFSSIRSIRKIVKKNELYEPKLKYMLVWSFMIQTFVILYSFTGLPHFDFEINMVYMVACAESIAVAKMIKAKDV